MPIIAFILVLILIKTSLMGLGLLSIGLASFALITIKTRLLRLDEALQTRFTTKFKLVIYAHLVTYLLLVLKLSFLEGWHDVPAFIASHLVMQHVISASIAGILTWQTISTYQRFRRQTR